MRLGADTLGWGISGSHPWLRTEELGIALRISLQRGEGAHSRQSLQKPLQVYDFSPNVWLPKLKPFRHQTCSFGPRDPMPPE